MKFGNLQLKTKIMSGYVLPMVIIIFLGSTGIMTLRFIVGAIKSMDEIAQLNQQAMEIQHSFVVMEKALLAFVATGEEQKLKNYEKAGKVLSAQLASFRTRLSDEPDDLRALQDAERAVAIWRTKVVQPVVERRKTSSDAKTILELNGILLGEEAERQMNAIRNALRVFQEGLDRRAKNHVEQVAYYGKLMENLVIYGVSFSILLIFAISYWLAQRISASLLRAVNLAEAISAGDLTQRLNVKGTDEVGRLAVALDSMVDNLRNQARQMSEAVNVLAASATEISTTVSQVAESTSSTSTSVTETTATVEEVKQAASVASSKSKQVALLAQQSVSVSSEGRKATEETIERMNLIKQQMESVGETVVRLSEQSQAIEDIISTVQDLAEQSNLLAVNASIEAARAGEEGKGFAVVAQEIKSLADQSREATEQIRTILEDTRKWVSAVVMATEQGTKAVDKGVEQSAKAGDAIGALGGSVEESAQAASVIESISEQQVTGMDQVSVAMNGIEMAVRQNLSGTRQLEVAAKRLSDLGDQLRSLVEEYRT